MNQPQFVRNTHNSSFIAYDSKPSKKPVALTVNGEPVQERLHPDVFINEYMSIQVKEVKDGEGTVNVVFDAKTAVTGSDKKMKYDFGANLRADSPLVGLARQAQQQSRPVYIGIETRRRWKSKDGEVIPYTTPIHVLRGCKDGPQSSGNSNETGNNCSKVLAVIGFADEPETTLVSDEARSNPYKWANVRDNQDGDLPPQGTVIPSGPEGQPVGGFIVASAAPAAAAGASPEILEKLESLTKMVAHLQRSSSSGGGSKPWNERTADGSINPSSYAVSQVRHTRQDAARLVAEVAPQGSTGPQMRGWESDLTTALLWIADCVQERVTGVCDRMAKAHTEAGGWVSHVVEFEEPFTADMLTDAEAKRTWAKTVRDAAAERYMEAVTMTQSKLDSQAGVSPQNSPSEPREEDNAPQQEAPAQDAEVMLSDDAQAREMWDGLIETIGMAQYVEQLNPVLEAQFGTYLSAQIPAADMRAALSEWMANPQDFRSLAEQKYREKQQSTQPQGQAA